MTDKDFDRLLKDALTSDDVPPSLNESLISLSQKQKNKKAKIFKFVKTCSSCAAVFICAVAVLSYFNSDLFSKDSTAPLEEINTSLADENNSQAEDIIPENTADILPEEKNDTQEDTGEKDAGTAKKIQPEQETAAESGADAPQTAASGSSYKETAALDTAAVYEDETAQEEAAPAEFAMRKTVPTQTLHTLFNDDFDYKMVISERISSQISMLPYAQEVTFSGVSGDERFSINEENMLTIEFSAGTIAPEEHGDLFFTVGTVQDGVLVE